MKALVHSHRFNRLGEDWFIRVKWIIHALRKMGHEVYLHPNLKTPPIPQSLEPIPIWDNEEIDIVIFNHTDLPEVLTFNTVPKTDSIWIFKPTVPHEFMTTLDELGYGSYSSITYQKPPYENCSDVEVNEFYDTKVEKWINSKACKWGENHFKEAKVLTDDYHLIIGQCGGDAVVTRQDFGNHFDKIKSITKEILQVDLDREVIVKLHPYTNGPMENPNETNDAELLTKELKSYSPRVKVYSDHSSIHSFLPNARTVFVGNSGAGFEAMMHNKPIIAFSQPEYHWVTYDLRKLCDITNSLRLDWFQPESQRKFLYWYMEKYCFYDYDTTERRVKELLEEEIEYKTIFK